MGGGLGRKLVAAGTFIVLVVCLCMYGLYFFTGHLYAMLTLNIRSDSTSLPVVWMIVFLFLASISITSFLRAALTDPGQVPFAFSFEAVATNETFPLLECENTPYGTVGNDPEADLEVASATVKEAANLATLSCATCEIFKPERTHHCSHCDRCVLKYDHHCRWIGQCVGFYNYKFYLLFLLSTWLLAWVVNLTLTVPAAQAAAIFMGAEGVDPMPGCGVKVHPAEYVRQQLNKLPPRDVLSATIAPMPREWAAPVCGLWMLPLFVVSVVGQLFLGFLVSRHFWLVLGNITTVELVQMGWTWPKPKEWKYNKGSLCGNLRAIVGSDARWFEMVLPIAPRLSLKDAVHYPERREVPPTPLPGSFMTPRSTRVSDLHPRAGFSHPVP